jgi:hypothetical protein
VPNKVLIRATVSGYSERTPLQIQQNTLNEYQHHILFYLLPIAFLHKSTADLCKNASAGFGRPGLI